MSKGTNKRIERLEGIVIGAGFLLKKLQQQYGRDFGVGMTEQVRDCIRDCDQVGRAQQQREAAAPPKPVPLTHMQFVLLWGHRSDGPSTSEIVSFGSAVERHHGIGVEP